MSAAKCHRDGGLKCLRVSRSCGSDLSGSLEFSQLGGPRSPTLPLPNNTQTASGLNLTYTSTL